MGTIRCLLLLLIIGSSFSVFSQVVSTMPAATKTKESFFLYEVKLIDEFIERFNDDKSSYIRQQSISMYGTDTFINRNRLVKSLFDKNSKTTSAEQFINEITTPAQFLSFTDSNWYAEASCIFVINGKKTEVPLILHIKTVNGASKWMIAGIGKSTFAGIVAQPLPVGITNDFIPTSAHGTNFVVFHKAFSANMHPSDYFEPALMGIPLAQQLLTAVMQGKAKFQHVIGIRYHFFQIDGWVFTVDQFKRKETNTGLLISSLQRADAKDKAALRVRLLFP